MIPSFRRPGPRLRSIAIALFAAAQLMAPAIAAARDKPADTVFTGGAVYTVDAADRVASALAVRDGRIVYVGDEAGAKALVGKGTRTVALEGRMLMPGLVDGHMHPQSGGLNLLMCNLEYARLTREGFLERIRACLAREADAGPDDWLEVINWFQQDMEPKGLELTHADLEELGTPRPVVVRSSFGHTTLANRRALALAGITRDTPDPHDGRIWRDAAGEPTGLLEDGAQGLVSRLVPKPDAATHLAATRRALDAMRRQGITAFLDVYSDPETLAAYREVERAGELTARAHFGAEIVVDAKGDTQPSLDRLREWRRSYDAGAPRVAPTLRLHTAKLFLDGVIAAPALTGVMVEPYFVEQGDGAEWHWAAGTSRGPAPYFSRAQLDPVLRSLVEDGVDPHLHADGDGAVRLALDAFAALRESVPDRDFRPAIAHAEIVHPQDLGRFAALDVTPVLSFQWQKPAADTIDGLRDVMGPWRHALIEPAGVLAQHGARIAFGSDWPVDALDEWFALQVAVTRRAADKDASRYPGRLGVDPGLSLAEALRAITARAAWTLRLDDVAGSLEPGKFADLIVLDRDLRTIPPAQIGATRVLLTMVGGKVVWEAPGA